MSEVVDFHKLEYNLIARDNAKQLNGIVPDKLIYNIRKREDTHCMVACDDSNAYGVCVFMCTEIGVFIQFIEVSSFVRRQYIGGALLTESLKWAMERGALAARVELGEEDTELRAFFEGCFFEETERYTETYFSMGSISESKFFDIMKRDFEKKATKPEPAAFIKDGVLRLDQVSVSESLKFSTRLEKEDRYRSFIDPNVERHLSVVYLKDGEIIGCILIGKYENELAIEYADTEDIQNPKALAEMIYMCYSTAAEAYPAETGVYVKTINETAEKIMKKLVPSPISQETRYVYQLIL